MLLRIGVTFFVVFPVDPGDVPEILTIGIFEFGSACIADSLLKSLPWAAGVMFL